MWKESRNYGHFRKIRIRGRWPLTLFAHHTYMGPRPLTSKTSLKLRPGKSYIYTYREMIPCFSCFYLCIYCVCSRCCICFLCSQDWYSKPNWLSLMTTDFSRATLKFTWSRFVRKEKKLSLHVTRILLFIFSVFSSLSLFPRTCDVFQTGGGGGGGGGGGTKDKK